MRDIRIYRQSRKQRNFHHTCANHHIGQPDGRGTDIPEIKICGGVQDTGLQAESSGGQDAVYPDADLLGQSHIDDDRKNAEQERGGKTHRHIFDLRREKRSKAGDSQHAEQSCYGDKKL